MALKCKYLPEQPTEPLPTYSGQPNAGLDEDIQLWEVTAAIQKLRKHTAPGADQISDMILATSRRPGDIGANKASRQHLEIWQNPSRMEDRRRDELRSCGHQGIKASQITR
ncbi:hypothetical protein HPB52_023172 [Rhipicephalus sanguineus]|uniref:Uncharacterized protein n=1 Tax=Rhipicephalus sanguineus TaxID=34632 RepID=A0A9D4T6J0_RHISA|nr:hypothetical protein HPB52_023172 [Rhipicephalus sanguineus]